MAVSRFDWAALGSDDASLASRETIEAPAGRSNRLPADGASPWCSAYTARMLSSVFLGRLRA
jgi:hypothetical protein